MSIYFKEQITRNNNRGYNWTEIFQGRLGLTGKRTYMLQFEIEDHIQSQFLMTMYMLLILQYTTFPQASESYPALAEYLQVTSNLACSK